MSDQWRCFLCGVFDGEKDTHLHSDEHRNAVEIDRHLLTFVYAPEMGRDDD